MTVITGYTGSTITHALAQASIPAKAVISHAEVSMASTGSVTVMFTTIDNISSGW